MAERLQLFAIPGIPEVSAGTDLAAAIAAALDAASLRIEAGDVVVVAQKIVSKAEGAIVRLADVEPSDRAASWAAAWGRDPAVVEIVLRESRRIVRMERGIIIAETCHGFVCANAGVDSSNVPPGFVTLLPRNPDASAARLRAELARRVGHDVAIIVSDTFGRPWREGVVDVALGVAGLQALSDWRGRRDSFGRTLHSTIVAVADQIASAAELVMRKTARTPVAIVRGGDWAGEGTAAEIVRAPELDLFR